MTDIQIIIPCYNEERRLPVEAFVRFTNEHPDYSFLFVNDGSKDGTLEVLRGLEEKLPDSAVVLDLEENQGKAEAVRRGVLQAIESGAKIVGFWDADLATPLDVLPDFVQVFEDRREVEIVTGARVQMLGRKIQRSLLRHYLGRIFATVVSFLYGVRVYDTQCGAKLFRVTPTMKDIFEGSFTSRWIFDVELLVRHLHSKQGPPDPIDTVYEFPLPSWHDVGGSKVRPTDFLTAFGDLIAIYRENR